MPHGTQETSGHPLTILEKLLASSRRRGLGQSSDPTPWVRPSAPHHGLLPRDSLHTEKQEALLSGKDWNCWGWPVPPRMLPQVSPRGLRSQATASLGTWLPAEPSLRTVSKKLSSPAPASGGRGGHRVGPRLCSESAHQSGAGLEVDLLRTHFLSRPSVCFCPSTLREDCWGLDHICLFLKYFQGSGSLPSEPCATTCPASRLPACSTREFWTPGQRALRTAGARARSRPCQEPPWPPRPGSLT